MPSVLALLQLTWRLYKENVSLLLGYSAWILVPYIFLIVVEMTPIPPGIETAVQTILYLLQILLIVWATNAMIVVTFAAIRKKEIKLDVLGGKAWRLVPPVIVVAVLNTLIILGGLLLLLIPGLIFSVWYGFSQMEVVLHKKRGWQALAASQTLVHGRFWPVAWRLVAGPVILLLGYVFIVAILIATTLFTVSPEAALIAQPTLWQEVIASILDMLALPLFVIYSTLVYLDLHDSRKGISTKEQLV